jgi:hypothetical protein
MRVTISRALSVVLIVVVEKLRRQAHFLSQKKMKLQSMQHYWLLGHGVQTLAKT